MALQHLRSSTADKRPTPAAMSDGQLALNTNLVSPGLFFKDSNGDSVKIGPVHVGTTAPNVTPGAGGQAGNSKGEAWLDTTAANPILKVFNGTAFVAVQPVGTGTVVSTTDTGTVTSTMILDGTILNADINASAGIVDTKLATIATAGKVSNSATTATNANTASAIVARDASGNFTAGTITAALTGNASTVTTNANLTGDVTSVGNATSIASDVIVNADVNASAAIAGTKISPDFGSQTVTTTGVISSALGAAATPSLTFTGDLNTGIFSPGADQLAISTNGSERLRITSAGLVGIGTSSPGSPLTIAGNYTGTSNMLELRTTVGGVDGGGRIVWKKPQDEFINSYISSSRQGANSTAQIEFGTTTDIYSVNATTKMVILGSGNVGIGTTSPDYLVHAASAVAGGGDVGFRVQDTTNNKIAQLMRSGSTYSYIGIGATEGVIYTDTTLTLAADSSSPIKFCAGGSERARIDSSGKLLVGTTSSFGSGRVCISSAVALGLRGVGSINSGDIDFHRADNNAKAWGVATNGDDFYIANGSFARYAVLQSQDTFTGWTFGSDRRIKKNIVDLTYGLDAVLALQPREFDYINNDQHDIGFIAQELKEVIPEAVSGAEVPYADEDTPQERARKTMGITREALIPVLVKAIQEQQVLITALTARVAALEAN